MIDAARLQIEHFGCKQCGKPDRPRRADDDLSKFFPLNVIEHLQNRRETQLLEFILGQFKFANGREIFERNIIDVRFATGDHHHQFLSGFSASCSHLADGRRDSVDVFQGVSEPGAFAILQRQRNFPGQFRKNGPQPFSRRRLAMKPVDVRCQNH